MQVDQAVMGCSTDSEKTNGYWGLGHFNSFRHALWI